MPKKLKNRSRIYKSKGYSGSNNYEVIRTHKHVFNDKFLMKLKDYFLFSECMFYNKEFLSWRTNNCLDPSVHFTRLILRLKKPNIINWQSFKYHKLIGQGSFGKGFIASLNLNDAQNQNSCKNICLIKMIGARKEDDIQNHYSQLINERDSLIKLRGVWTPKLYACFIERKLASIFVQEFIDGETITYIKKLLKIDNGRDFYPILNAALNDIKELEKIPYLNQRQYEIIQFYMGELISALKFIHSQGVLHRDLKENNILLTCDGHLKLIDFGLAKRVCWHDSQTYFNNRSSPNGPSKESCCTNHLLQPFVSNPMRLWGNRYYAAPEYILEQKSVFDDKGDYWAVGIIFFHLLFGCRPYKHIIRDKAKELNQSIGNWKVKSFLQYKFLKHRCRNYPQLLEPFFSMICDVENRLSDKSVSSFDKTKWLPETWELFEPFNLWKINEYPSPIKIPSNKKMHLLNSNIELKNIIEIFNDDKYTEHLDCPYFNYISPINNDLLDDVILIS